MEKKLVPEEVCICGHSLGYHPPHISSDACLHNNCKCLFFIGPVNPYQKINDLHKRIVALEQRLREEVIIHNSYRKIDRLQSGMEIAKLNIANELKGILNEVC